MTDMPPPPPGAPFGDPSGSGDDHPTAPIQPGPEFAAPWYPPFPPPGQAPPTTSTMTPTPVAQPRRRTTSGRGLAASVVAASLLLGGAAGVGGAAAWGELHHDPAVVASSPSTVSSVVDTGTSTAPAGSVEAVAKQVLPSVVKIEVSGSQEQGSGSGIILSSDGEILTNNHVAAVAGKTGSIVVDFNDGTQAKASILGTDPLTDTAVIKAEGVSDLKPATIGKSANLAVGESVVAIGSPFGLDSTVTSGIVSALDRPVDVGQVTETDGSVASTVYPAVQTDAAINPGNSGGPLVDLDGDVVGINSSIQSTTDSSDSSAQSGSIGLGFAIPIDEVLPIIQQMIKGETPTHARLGVSVQDVANQDAQGAQVTGDGAKIHVVDNGSTADQAGLAVGDVITKVDDTLITGSDSLVATVRSYRPGDHVKLTYTHDGQTKTADLTLDSDGDTQPS